MKRSPIHLEGWTKKVRRGTVVYGVPWWKIITTALLIFAFVAFLTGCTCAGLNRQTLDQVDAAIKSAEGFKERSAKGQAVPETLVDIHLDNLKGAKKNIERVLEDE